MTRIERTREPKNLAGSQYLPIESIHVMEYHEQADGMGEPTQVHMMIEIEGMDVPMVARFHFHETISHLIEALTVHRNSVWPRKRMKR